jgi:putative transposase
VPPPRRKRLRRYERPNDVRFLTFSTYQRLPLFQNDRIKDRFAHDLAAARNKFRFHLYAWVIMPEHVHLLMWPLLPECPVPTVLRELKRPFAEDVIDRWRSLSARVLDRLQGSDGAAHFWQPGGGYDRNIHSMKEFNEKRNYIHNNPVTRGLVARPEDWPWSSARWYAGDRTGPVSLNPLPPRRPNAGAAGSAESPNRP